MYRFLIAVFYIAETCISGNSHETCLDVQFGERKFSNRETTGGTSFKPFREIKLLGYFLLNSML